MEQSELIDVILARALREPDRPLESFSAGSRLACAASRRMGLASVLPGLDAPDYSPGGPAHEAAELLREQGSSLATVGLAAVNSLLPVPQSQRVKAQDVIAERGEGRRVAVVGHFPFVARIGHRFSAFHVLELRPGPGDLPAERAAEVLCDADVVALTATTLMNGTLAGLLALIPSEAYVVMLGPSTPFCEDLFSFGLDALAGAVVTDPEAAARGVARGGPFKDLLGVDFVFWEKNGARA